MPASSRRAAPGTPTTARRSARARTTRASSCVRTPKSRSKSRTRCASRWASRCWPPARLVERHATRRAMAARPLSLKARALQWLAQREHSRVELRRKLLRVARQRAAEAAETGEEDPSAGAEAEVEVEVEVEAVLDWLAAHHYLSEARFV